MASKTVTRAEGEPLEPSKRVVDVRTVVQTEHFAGFYDENRGVWNVQPVGWVGEAPLVVHQSKLASLGDLVAEILR